MQIIGKEKEQLEKPCIIIMIITSHLLPEISY